MLKNEIERRRKYEKLLAMAACAAMALGVCVMPVNAASGVNEAEQQILDYVEKGVSIQGETISFVKGSDEYNTLEEYFALDDIDLTQKDVDTIISSVKNTKAFMEIHWDDEMTVDLLNEMLDLMAPATNTLNMKISYDVKADKLIITDMDGNVWSEQENFMYPEETTPTTPEGEGNKGGNGNTVKDKVNTNDKALEKTGEDFSSTYVIFASLAAVLVGAGFIASRKRIVKE